MKIIFFGLGSIGKRHLSLLKSSLFKNSNFEFYAYRSGKTNHPTPNGVQVLSTWNAVKSVKPEVAFICNPTSSHVDTAILCANEGMHLFIEKPIGHNTDRLDELLKIVRIKKLTAYVAYPLRFHPKIQEFKTQYALKNQVGRIEAKVLSYLPDWRPGTDHLKSYSAQRKLGGGVILDLSHEFDLMEYLFGSVSKIEGTAERTGNVTVDCEDHAQAHFNAGRFEVDLEMSLVSKEAARYIAVELPMEKIKIDLLNAGNEMFVMQLKYFFNNIHNPELMNNLSEASPLFKKILAFRERAFS